MASSTPKDILLGDDIAGQAELLLSLLSDAAAGRELSNVVSDVIQVGPALRPSLSAEDLLSPVN